MTFEEALAEVESLRFASSVSVASDFRTFREGVRSSPAVLSLVKELRSPPAQNCLLTHLLAVARRPTDPAYANPWDTALTVYLWLLNRVAPSLARIGAAQVLQVPRCWWARKLSLSLLHPARTRGEARSERPRLGPAAPGAVGAPASPGEE
jgi:hypothetical protein